MAVRHRLLLDHDGVAALAGMGPSAAHITAADLAARVAALPEPLDVGVAVEVSCWSPRAAGSDGERNTAGLTPVAPDAH